jgi:rubredoxin
MTPRLRRKLHIKRFDHSLCGLNYKALVGAHASWVPADLLWDYVPDDPRFEACEACTLLLLTESEGTL